MRHAASWLHWTLLLALACGPLHAAPAALPLPAADRDTLVTLTGLGQATIDLTLTTGQAIALTVQRHDVVTSQSHARAFHKGPAFPATLADGAILISLGSTPHWGSAITRLHWVRPDPGHYAADEQAALLARWHDLPGVSSHQATLRLSGEGDTLRLWLDGRFFTHVKLPAPLHTLTLTLADGASAASVTQAPPLADGRHLTVEVPHYARPGDRPITHVSLKPGGQVIQGVPMRVSAIGQEINIGLARVLKPVGGPRTNYYDQYHMRTPLDGVPETVMLRVPSRPYSQAHVLCAVEEDPEKSPVMSLRLSRYFAGSPAHLKRGRGNAVAESELRLLDDQGQPLPHITPVGQATIGQGRDARPVTLYLARVALNTGDIADLLAQTGLEDAHQGDTHAWGMTTDYLDLELAGPLEDWHPPTTNFGRRPLGKPSAVRVLGLTLEELPVAVALDTGVRGNHLYRHEQPALTVRLTPTPSSLPYHATLSYTLTDYFGRVVRQSRQPVAVNAQPHLTTLDLGDLDHGWYRFDMTLTDEPGRPAWRQATTLAILPPDTRQAKADSPFGMWWNKYYHLGEGDLAVIGPIYRKVGMRHTIASVTNHSFFGRNYTLDELAKHDMGLSQLNSLRLINRQRLLIEPLDVPAARKEIAENLKGRQSIKRALIYHEHRLQIDQELAFPAELLGREPEPLPERAQKRLELFRDNAVAMSKLYRELAPDVKLYHGNSHRFGFHHMIYLRGGFPREYLDVLSLEHTGSQKTLPESQPHPGKHGQVLWMLRALTRHYGYGDVPISASYENLNIPSDGLPSLDGIPPLHHQAQHYVRQFLHAMAYGVDVLHGGNVQDVNNAYYWTHWGPAGFNYRDLTPKPSFLAVATLTQVLDQARYVRWIDTGSDAVYCLEFDRHGRPVYVMWSVRETRDMTLTLAKPADVVLVNLVGGQTTLAPTDTLTLTVSPDPVYLQTTAHVAQVTLGDPPVAPPTFRVGRTLDTLQSPANWRQVAQPDTHYESLDPGTPRQQGRVEIAPTQDARVGAAIAVKLLPQPDAHPLVARYVMLEPAKPIVIEQPVRGLAVQVRGDASWSRVHWELQDAQGHTWKLTEDLLDRTAIHFDGWRWIDIMLPTQTPGGQPGPANAQWTGFKADRKPSQAPMAYPIRLTRLVVELRSHLVHLTDLKPVRRPGILLRNLVTVE